MKNTSGHGSMGISSSIGSNTFDILLCLGLPWFIKASFYPTVPGDYWVNLFSTQIVYVIKCLFLRLIIDAVTCSRAHN